METVIALARNGLCVIVDTLHAEHVVMSPLKALLDESSLIWVRWLGAMLFPITPNVPLEELSLIKIFIALLQLCAVYYNMHGLAIMSSAWRHMNVARRRLMETSSHTMKIGLEIAIFRAGSDLAYGITRFLLGPSFFVLALFTLKMTTARPVEYALLVMQIALAAALWAMFRDLSARRTKSHNARQLAMANEKELTEIAQEKPSVFAVIDDLQPSSSLQIARIVLSPDSASSVEKSASIWLTKAKAMARDNKQNLHDLADRESTAVIIDLFLLLLNIVAFFGYLVFPLTYFGPIHRDPEMEWLGNFVGDLAWTIEPALILASSTLSAFNLFRKEKIKSI